MNMTNICITIIVIITIRLFMTLTKVWTLSFETINLLSKIAVLVGRILLFYYAYCYIGNFIWVVLGLNFINKIWKSYSNRKMNN